MNRRQFLIKTAMIGSFAVVGLSACEKIKQYTKIASGSKVIALGDSLTFGYGADKNQSYPVKLATKTGWNVINAGINGDTSEGVLNRLIKLFNKSLL